MDINNSNLSELKNQSNLFANKKDHKPKHLHYLAQLFKNLHDDDKPEALSILKEKVFNRITGKDLLPEEAEKSLTKTLQLFAKDFPKEMENVKLGSRGTHLSIDFFRNSLKKKFLTSANVFENIFIKRHNIRYDK